MSETVTDTIPKSFRERLDEIPEKSFLTITEAERKNFQLEMNRSFHSNKDSTKKFKIRTDPVTDEIRVWRKE